MEAEFVRPEFLLSASEVLFGVALVCALRAFAQFPSLVAVADPPSVAALEESSVATHDVISNKRARRAESPVSRPLSPLLLQVVLQAVLAEPQGAVAESYREWELVRVSVEPVGG